MISVAMAPKLKRAERRNRLRKHGMNGGDARTEPGAERSRFAGGSPQASWLGPTAPRTHTAGMRRFIRCRTEPGMTLSLREWSRESFRRAA
jgi:hypothetical protein